MRKFKGTRRSVSVVSNALQKAQPERRRSLSNKHVIHHYPAEQWQLNS